MPKLITLFRSFTLLAALLAGQAQAQDASIDSVLEVPRVNDLSFGPRGERMLLTLSDRVLIYSLFPLRLERAVPLDVRGYAAGLSAQGNLFVLGDNPNTTGSEGGTIQVYQGVLKGGDLEAQAVALQETTPLSDIQIARNGSIFVSSPTRLKVLGVSETAIIEQFETRGALRFDDLVLACDTAFQFDVFPIAGELYYAASSTGANVLELGRAVHGRAADNGADCFSPAPEFLTRSTDAVGNLEGTPLEYALVNTKAFLPKADEFITDFGVLSFDASRVALSFVPIEKFDSDVSFVRSESIFEELSERMQVGTGRPQAGLIAADRDGQTILLAFAGTNRVFRLRWSGSDFDYIGAFDLRKPVRQIVASANGRDFALTLQGAKGEPEEVLVLRDLNILPDFAALPKERFTVELLQEELNINASETIDVDGIYGPETRSMIFWESGEVAPGARSSANYRALFPTRAGD